MTFFTSPRHNPPDPDYSWTNGDTPPRQFLGTLPDDVLPGVAGGIPVLVTVHDDEGRAELAFKTGDGAWSRWGIPVELSEESEHPTGGAA